MDELFAAVQQAAGAGYQVYGELGREHQDDIWYLARDTETSRLVAMRLYAEKVAADGHREYGLEVARELSSAVSIGMGECPKCAMPVRRWGRFCTRCGANLADSGPDSSPGDREALLALVRREAGDLYEILGEMPWSGGGQVFFALEKTSGRLVRLRLKNEGGQNRVQETMALMQLGDRLQAGYLTEVRSEPPQPPLPPPPPPLPKPSEPAQPIESTFQSTGPVSVPQPDVLPPRRVIDAEPQSPHFVEPEPWPGLVIEPEPRSHRGPSAPKTAKAGGTDWQAPLSAREWLLVVVIVGLMLIVLLMP
jgi:hypothetical protein